MATRDLRKTAFSFGLGIALGIVSATGGRAVGDHNPDDSQVGDFARLEASSPAASSDCEVEMEAYNQAVQDREDAELAERAAYRAWYDCEMGGSGPPTSTAPVLSAEYSVLLNE